MPIDFPSSPTVGQTYTYAGVTYTYTSTGTWAGSTIISAGVSLSNSRLANLAFAVAASAGALTISVKSADGNDPSVGNSVDIDFRNVTGTIGTPTTLSVQAANSLTISSGSTLGVVNATAFRIWIVGFNDGGTFRLGAINCMNAGQILPVREGINSATNEGGAGAADSAGVIYSTAAVTAKAMRILGYLEWNTSGLVAAGTWTTTNLIIVQVMGPGVRKPGDEVQVVYNQTGAMASGAGSIGLSDTIPINTNGVEYMSQAITPTSAANALKIESKMVMYTSGTGIVAGALFQDSVVNALAVAKWYMNAAGDNDIWLSYMCQANTASSTTFKMRSADHAGSTVTFNGRAGVRIYGGVADSFLRITEIMA